MKKFQLTVHQFRESLDIPDEERVQRYALDRANSRRPNPEIQYQKEVLGRMVERGCKPCEKKRQEQYIAQLDNQLK